ncbi:MAG: hypothetical protein ABH827_00415 [bacterium]
MKSKKLKNGLLFYRYLFSFGLFFSTLIYLIISFGLGKGFYLMLLSWSLYILCLPAAHGQLLIGYPVYALFRVSFYIEAYLWLIAVLFNLYTYFCVPGAYMSFAPTHLLFRIISAPNPYWLIIAISALGTFYNVMARLGYFYKKAYKHVFTRYILVLGGFLTFFYLAYQEIIIVLNSF